MTPAVENILAVLVVIVLPLVALVWPLRTLPVAGSHSWWGRWGLAGCMLFAFTLIPLGTFVVGDNTGGDDSGVTLLLGVPIWLLGGLNAAVAGTGVSRRWLRRPWVVVLAVPASVAALTWLGVAAVTRGGLPEITPPGEGELTGATVEYTTFGPRRSAAYEFVVAFPVSSVADIHAVKTSADGYFLTNPPILRLTLRRRGALQVTGIRMAEVENTLFTISGLSEDGPYWVCADDDSPLEDVWSFEVCDLPAIEVPAQVLISDSPQGGGHVIPLSGGR